MTNYKINLLLFITLIIICIFFVRYIEKESIENELIQMGSDPKSPYCLRLYNLIEIKSREFNIPKYILYNIAYNETRYRGPFDWQYNPKLTSSAGAEGAMQIITRFAHHYAGRKVTAKELRENIELNVTISCRMLRDLYNRYGRWDIVCGYYNTGYPQINDYATRVTSNRHYRLNWIEPNLYAEK